MQLFVKCLLPKETVRGARDRHASYSSFTFYMFFFFIVVICRLFMGYCLFILFPKPFSPHSPN